MVGVSPVRKKISKKHMAKSEDKGKVASHDQSKLLGEVPSNLLGPDRSTHEAKIVGKLKGKKASALKAKDANVRMNKANISKASDALNRFMNRA